MVEGRPENQTEVVPWIIGGTALTGLASLGALALMARKNPASLLRTAGHTPARAPIDIQDLLKSLSQTEEGFKVLGRGVQDLQSTGAARRAKIDDLTRRVTKLKLDAFDLPGVRKDLDAHEALLKVLEGGSKTTPPRSGHLKLIKEAWIINSRLLW